MGPVIDGDGGAEGVAEIGVPEAVGVPAAQDVDALAVLEGEGELVEAAFEVARLVADDVAIEQALVDGVAIVVANDADHQFGVGSEVALER